MLTSQDQKPQLMSTSALLFLESKMANHPLVKLAHTLGKVNGPSRDLDWKLWFSINEFDPKHVAELIPPYYTFYIEEAAKLLPEGFGYEVHGGNEDGFHNWAQVYDAGRVIHYGIRRASTSALALCAAILYARAEILQVDISVTEENKPTPRPNSHRAERF